MSDEQEWTAVDRSGCAWRARLFERTAADARLTSTAVQTVGSKGWDGFSVTLVEG